MRRLGAGAGSLQLVFAASDCQRHAGQLNYSVQDGSQLTVDIDSPASTVVKKEGSQTDSFMYNPVRIAEPHAERKACTVPDMHLELCQVPGLNKIKAPAPAKPSPNATMLGLTWSPTRAVFPTLQNDSLALLSMRSAFCMLRMSVVHTVWHNTLTRQVFAFDTSCALRQNKTCYARSGRFSFNITVTL